LERQIFDVQTKLDGLRPLADSYVAKGPDRIYEDEAELLREAAALWRRSSLQMHRLGEANGFRYFHLLQPNQYVKGSKQMGAAERARALHDKHPYRPAVEMGYQYLIEEGAHLTELGVSFYDLSQIFADAREPIYVDACCHINRKGYRIIASYLVGVIAAEVAEEVGANPPG
jgi:hypothetical protein